MTLKISRITLHKSHGQVLPFIIHIILVPFSDTKSIQNPGMGEGVMSYLQCIDFNIFAYDIKETIISSLDAIEIFI